MKIRDIRLYLAADQGGTGATSGNIARRGWVTQLQVANPMSVYPAYAAERRSWMGPGQDHYAIEIETDGGDMGVCANYYGGPMACAIIDQHFRRFLIGQDPFDTARIWDQMDRASLPYGLGGLTAMAMAGVDLALWDLKGKLAGLPVYRLIGGATKPEGIRCYVTTHPDCAAGWGERGFLGVKVAAPWGQESGHDGIASMAAMLARLRETLGGGTELMVDCYMSWSHDFALRLAERIRGLDIKWFEDPLPNGHAAAANRALRERIAPVGLAVGNLEFHHRAFAELLDASACDVIQPEVHWIGGLTPLLWIAAYAGRHRVPVVPHGPNVYPFHFVMANAGSPYAEFVTGGDGRGLAQIFDLLLDQPLPVGGRMLLPDRPGFGVRLNMARLRPYRGEAR